MKNKLNDAVVSEWRKRNQLRSCCDDDPRRRMMKEIHGLLELLEGGRASTPCYGKPVVEVLMPIVACQHCSDRFETPNWRLRQGKGKYCSKDCANQAMRSFHAMYPAEYMAYHDARRRCVNPYHETNKKNYRDRGIKFLFSSFEEFFDCVGARPAGASLDRIDNDGNYEPGNVRWATAKQQAQNRQNNKKYTLQGLTLCASEWDRRLGLHRGTVSRRIEKYGWPLEKALTQPSTSASTGAAQPAHQCAGAAPLLGSGAGFQFRHTLLN